MPYIPVANTAMVEVRMIQDSQQVENTLYFSRDDDISSVELLDLSFQVLTKWINHFIPILPNNVQLTEVFCRDLTTNPGLTQSSSAPGSIFGGRTGQPLPNNNSLSVSFRTGFSGRGNRGRNYWVGLTESDVTNNLVSSAIRALITDAYYSMVGTSAVADGWTWGVVSRYYNNSPRPAGQVLDVVSVVIVDNVVDSQRRRLPGRGR